jgi:hypothetical protein
MFCDGEFSGSLKLEDGDTLFLCTDGLSEVRTAGGLRDRSHCTSGPPASRPDSL